jgi:hypothetical protein
MDGPAHLIVWNFARILFGLYIGTAAILGYALTPLAMPWRVLYGILSLLIWLPPDPFGMTGYYINFIGIGAAVALLVIEHLRRREVADKARIAS